MRRNFVTAEALHAQLSAEPESVVAVDCRFNLLAPHAGFQSYLEGHIPGAYYAHLDKDLAALPRAEQGRHPLPDMAKFAEFLGVLGIQPDTHVVAYDDAGGAIAARMWWLLGEVGHAARSLLDGGIGAWQRCGFELTDRLPVLIRRDYKTARSRNAPVLTSAEVADFIDSGMHLLDARAAVRYEGKQEPIDPVAGHVPGAINVPVSDLLDADGRIRSVDEWEHRLRDAVGGQTTQQVGAMCGSGVTACLLIAALDSIGFGQARLYAGSWSEWIRDPARPVATTSQDP